MINQQLIDFVKQSLLKGYDKEKITNELLSTGWRLSDIEECFNYTTPFINKYSLTRKIILSIVVIFLFAGGIFAYYFKNNISQTKDKVEDSNVVISPINQAQNLQPNTKETVSVIQPKINQKNNAPIIFPKIVIPVKNNTVTKASNTTNSSLSIKSAPVNNSVYAISLNLSSGSEISDKGYSGLKFSKIIVTKYNLTTTVTNISTGEVKNIVMTLNQSITIFNSLLILKAITEDTMGTASVYIKKQ